MANVSSEYDLQRFFTMSRDMLCIAGFDGHFKLLSPAWQSILGYTFAELSAKPFIEFVHADDRASTLAESAKLSVGGVTVSFENRYYAKDGSLHRLSWSASADLDKQLVYAIAHDVTAQHDAMQLLHATSELQRGVLNGANYSIISTDCNGVIQTFNAAAERMLGYRADEMIGKQTPAILHDVNEVVQRAAELSQKFGITIAPGFDVFVEQARRGVIEECEWTYIRKDGSRFAVSLSVTALRNMQGTVAGFLGIAADISERKAAHAELNRFKSTLDRTLDCVFMFEPGTLKFFYVNHGAVAQLGYSHEELATMHPYDIKPDFPEPVFRQFIAPLLSGANTSATFETRHRTKSGNDVPVEVFLQYIATADEQPRFVAVVRDITERKRLDRMKSEFVSTVSHELRTPMNAILGFTQLLGYDRNLTEGQKGSLTKVRKAGEHLLKLINDVLDLSRIEAGKVVLSLEPVDLNAVLRECRNLAHTLADARNITLHINDNNAVDYWMRADKTCLSQVLINLISNAIKYNREGGAVWVTCAPGEQGRVRIAVRDNGRGIALDRQPHLFEPFNRLGAELGEVEGTGIGLTITKQLVELMGGKIGLVSTPTVGSTFWVEFAQENHTADAHISEAKNTSPEVLTTADGEHRVLYVEDNPTNLELVQALCARFWPNMQLLSATTAEAGLELAAAQRPDLILMDINLPGMDGYQALARLQADKNLCHVPVLAVTANAMTKDIERGRAAGFTDYLTKPIDIPVFLATVDRLLQRVPGKAPEPKHEVRVLLAEDNLVNQEVARGLLEVLGFPVDVVADGRAAVAALQHTRYAVVLMDCEMPVLDGYAATAEIRAAEGTTRRTPIIAVTAHAQEEDAERRQSAGMDDHLAKPINVDALRAVLHRWIKGDTAPAADSKPILDAHATGQLRDLLGAHAAPIVDSLLGDLPKRLELLRAAIERGDVNAVRHEAHTMKGSSSNLGASAFAELCALLSTHCKSGELQKLRDTCQALEREFNERSAPALQQFKRELLESAKL